MLYLVWLSLGNAFASEELDAILSRGPVAHVELGADGRVRSVTGIARVDAPAKVVWDQLLAFETYPSWMPQVAGVTVVSRDVRTVVADWTIDAPGPNVGFTASYALDADALTITGQWVKGALSGSHWEWRLVDEGQTTVVYRTVYVSAAVDNWVMRQFDDRWHSLEMGINTGTPVLELIALGQVLRGE